jgi:hypothetical protein
MTLPLARGQRHTVRDLFHWSNVTVPSIFCVANVSAKRILDRAGLFDNDFPYPAWDDFEMGLRLRARGMKAFMSPMPKPRIATM